MDKEDYNGIFFFNPPKRVDYFDFVFEHLDCDFIMENDEGDDDLITVVAYAGAKENNAALWMLFKARYENGGYSIGSHISKEQMNAIV